MKSLLISAPALEVERDAGAVESTDQALWEVFLRRHLATIALIAIVLLGAVLRLNGRDWDQSHYLNPDERFMTMVATGISWPHGIGEYFDSANSPLNPYNNNFPTYVYGTFPLFLGKLAGDVSGMNVYGNFHIPARTLSTLFDLMTVVMVYAVGRRLFGVRTGLLAALLMSLTALDIQASHFFTTDAYLATFVLGVFFLALRADDHGRWWEYLGAGVLAGLALATKLSALPAIAMLLLPAVEAVRRSGWRALVRTPRPRSLVPLLGVVLALIALVWTFRIAQPYAFEGPSVFSFKFDPRWTHDIDYWRLVQKGEIDMPPSHQWAARTPLVFLLKNLVLWGLGLPLGIAALAGLAAGGLRIATARRWPPTWQVILVGWPAVHILYYGTAFIKTMRYVLPAYPFLVLLAAALLVYIWEGGGAAVTSRLNWRAIPAVVVVVLTAAYAIAFSGIYSQDSTRITASRWIYDNVPQGTTVLTEHWDDAIPLLFSDEPTDAYHGSELQLYADDNLEKLNGGENQPGIINQLNGADYIFVTSNRLYLSIPRIPERFPMTIEYYRMLFSGELGFELVKTFTDRPTFLGFTWNDDNAEEAFTVYDHPKVLIFKKTPAYDGEKVRAHLTAALSNSGPVLNLRPIQTGKNFLMFDNAERLVQQAGGTWSAIFDRTDIANRHPIRVWYLALQLMALAAIPLCWRILHGLPDRGYAVAKTIGLLIAAYVAWLLPSLKLISFGRSAVLIGIAVAAALSVAAVWSRRWEFVRDMRARWVEILFVELLFLAAFFVFVWFRSVNPDLWHPYRGGEKPMEFAYFNAVIRSTHFPPYDPWFAGGYINYYYFGYVIIAAVVRLTGVIPSVAFNLAAPTLFALLVINSWSFVRNILSMLKVEIGAPSRWALPAIALLGPLFVVGIGNLDLARRIGRGEYGYGDDGSGGLLGLGGIGDIIRGTWRTFVHNKPVPPDAYWSPSRIIPDTVNEFPYFTFLFSDFHPHMAGLTVTSAVLVVALAVLQARRWPAPTDSPPVEPFAGLFASRATFFATLRSIPRCITIERGLMVGLVAFLTGVLFPLNAWDFPTYVLLVVGAFALLEVVSVVGVGEQSAGAWQLTYASLRRVAIWSAGTIVIGRLLFLPYFAHYQQPNNGFDAWTGSMTQPGQYLIIHGIFLFFVVSFLLAELATLAPGWGLPMVRFRGVRVVSFADVPSTRTLAVTVEQTSKPISPVLIVSSLLVVVGLLAILADRLLWLLAALALPVIAVAWMRRREPVHLFLCGMAGLALALSAAVERYTLRGDIGRFNTVFKFYLQIWVLLALVAAVGTAVMIARYRHLLAPFNRVGWAVIALVLLFAGLTYPVLATPARLDDRFNELPRTLDGMAYMQQAVYDDSLPDSNVIKSYPLKDDLDAINWLLNDVKGSPVILEAVTPLYRWGSRVSVYTGLPTVLGWDWHQTQQRAGYGDLINQRRDDVNEMLGGEESFEQIKPLLDKYHVRYIYVGALEHVYYSDRALAKFDDAVKTGALTVAYQQGSVTIYAYTPATP